MDNKTTNYLRIDKSGRFYTVADATTPGATAVKTKDGSTLYRVYRKFNSTIHGNFKRPYFKTVTFDTGDVEMIYFFIENDTETDCISFPLFSAHGGLNAYVKSIAQLIKHIDPQEKYYLRPSTKLKKNGYVSQSLFLSKASDKSWVKLPDEEFKLRPEVATKTRADGKILYDFTEQDNFVYKELMDGIVAVWGELESQQDSENQPTYTDTTSTMTTPPATQQEPAEYNYEDDLPF